MELYNAQKYAADTSGTIPRSVVVVVVVVVVMVGVVIVED